MTFKGIGVLITITMKNAVKVIVVSVLALCALGLLLREGASFQTDAAPMPAASPTPAGNAIAVKPVNAAANTKPAAIPAGNPNSGGKTIPKTFTLGKDSLSEYGEVAFDHDSHAFQNYSPDGKSVMGCVECHHTDQPKSALKPPLSTSEREVTMTFAVWQSGNFKVSSCRDCHFQDGNVPEGKEMPKATYTDTGKSVTKTLDNQLAYHINCNTCHDAAFKLRPELKKKPGFATTKDCAVCHKTN